MGDMGIRDERKGTSGVDLGGTWVGLGWTVGGTSVSRNDQRGVMGTSREGIYDMDI